MSNRAGQTHLAITTLHAAKDLAKLCFARIHALLNSIRQTAAQMKQPDCWRLLVQHIIALMIAAKPPSQCLLMPMVIGNSRI